MIRIRIFRLMTALMALFCVLFMQFAVAAYACPGMNPARAEPTSTVEHRMVAGCHGMDAKQLALCQAHDQSDNQSLDKPEIPQIQPFIPAQLLANLELSGDIGKSIITQAPEPALNRATAPPLAISHCCFRN